MPSWLCEQEPEEACASARLGSYEQRWLGCRFRLAVDFPGLRRSGSWSQIIDQAQYFSEHVPWHSDLGQLEGDIRVMAHDLGPDLEQLLAQRSTANALLPPIRLTSPLGLPSDFVGNWLLLRCGYVRELAAASYPHIHGSGGDFPYIAGGRGGGWRLI